MHSPPGHGEPVAYKFPFDCKTRETSSDQTLLRVEDTRPSTRTFRHLVSRAQESVGPRDVARLAQGVTEPRELGALSSTNDNGKGHQQYCCAHQAHAVP